MYALIAEDNTDVDMLQTLIRRLARNSSLPIRHKGYGGCGEMLRQGARQLGLFAELGCTRFIVCYDADGPDPAARRQEAIARIIKSSGQSATSCVALIPVQEIEAWILADLHQAVPKVIPSWQPKPVSGPEGIASPKEYLTRLSKGSNKKPLYEYTVHNSRVAVHLDLQAVRKKCPSFRPLVDFVVTQRGFPHPSGVFPEPNARTIWVYVGQPQESHYVQKLAEVTEWGHFTRSVRDCDEPPPELSRLCELGWANRTALESEVPPFIREAKPKGQVRTILQALQRIVTNQQDAPFIAVDDGTR